MTISRVRGAAPRLLVEIEGVADREAARRLTGARIEVDPSELPELEEDRFYVRDLLGCAVEAGGRVIGTVADVLDRPANDVLVVREDSGVEILVPFVAEVVREVDATSRVVHLERVPEEEA